MPIRIGLTLVAFVVFLSGCASTPQYPVLLSKDAVGPQAGRIGVVMTSMPELNTFFPGADCLLCMATASMMNSSLTKHARTLTYEDLPELKTEVARLLHMKGSDAVVIDGTLDVEALSNFENKGPNVATKDFTPLQQKYKVDRLLVIDITTLGFTRSYSAYIPVGDPKAQLKGTGYIVNLKSNTYDWYQPVSILKSADQTWDEPPKFPGLTNAYFQALELGKDDLLRPLVEYVVGAAAPAAGTIQPVPLPVAANSSANQPGVSQSQAQ